MLKATVDLGVILRRPAAGLPDFPTEGPQPAVLKKAAETAGVPVVDFSETLPDSQSYVQWMTANVESISKALG